MHLFLHRFGRKTNSYLLTRHSDVWKRGENWLEISHMEKRKINQWCDIGRRGGYLPRQILLWIKEKIYRTVRKRPKSSFNPSTLQRCFGTNINRICHARHVQFWSSADIQRDFAFWSKWYIHENFISVLVSGLSNGKHSLGSEWPSHFVWTCCQSDG